MEKCPECGNKLESEDKILANYYSCKKCGFEALEYHEAHVCCLYPKLIPIRYYPDAIEEQIGSDDYRIYMQCQNCGKKQGNPISKKSYQKLDLPLLNENVIENKNRVEKELQEISRHIQEVKKQKKMENFWDDYDEYLKSDKWKKIREIVFKRDNQLCQSCLNAKAEEIHHIDGKFRKNEPLFTLISVCKQCHNIITEIERGNYSVEPIIYKLDQ